MKNIFIIFGIILGVLWSDFNTLKAQNEQQTSITNKFFIGGLFSLFNKNYGANSSLRMNPNPRIFVIDPLGNNIIVTQRKSNSFSFFNSPYIGVKLNSRASIGLSTNIEIFRERHLTSDYSRLILSTNTFGLGLFYRKNYSISNKLTLFFQPNINYDRRTISTSFNNSKLLESVWNDFTISANVGAKYTFNHKWSFITNVSLIQYSFQSLNNPLDEVRQFNHLVNYDLNLEGLSIGLERSF